MITFSEIAAADRDYYDDCVTRLPEADFRQTYGWGEVREADGWVPRRFLATGDGVAVGCAQVLIGRLPHLPFRLTQVPAGPLIDYHSPETVKAFAELLRAVGQESGACFARIEPQLPDGDEMVQSNLAAAGFARSSLAWSFWNAPLEVLSLDLTPSEEQLFRAMRHSQRKNIRRFERGGGTVQISRDPEDLWSLHSMLRRLGERKGFMVRGTAYWQSLWSQFVERDRGVLLVARSAGQLVGCMFNMVCGRSYYTVHGADDPSKRRDRPNDALYWASIKHARSLGCSRLEMMGYVSESHLRFKLGLGARLERLTGYYDLPIRPLLYRPFASMEKHLLPRVVPAVARLTGRRRAEVPPDHGAG